MFTIFSAILADAASIIRPSSCAAPLPSFEALSSSSKIRFALLTSASGGEKTLLANSICDGCIAHFPSIPIDAPLFAAEMYASGSLKSVSYTHLTLPTTPVV